MPVDESARSAYYHHVFPWTAIQDKLYRKGVDVGMLFEKDIWDRRCKGKGADDVFAQILARNPKEVHFGALWKDPGAQASHDNFLWRPLVIDIDLPDYKLSAKGGDQETYKQFRTLATPDRDPSLPEFRKSWVFIEIAVEVIDCVLRENFGFTDCKWVSSGNKGVHCWVLDERACRLSGQARRAIFDYFTSDGGLFKESYYRDDANNPERVAAVKKKIFRSSPYLQLCYDIARPKMAVLLEDQNLWDEATRQILCEAPGSEAAAAKLRKSDAVHWYDYERVDHMRAVEFALKVALPRIDPHAAKLGQMSKIPFSVHDKTGKLAVPFDPKRVDVFDPMLAPTVADALDYHDAVSKGLAPAPGKNIGAYVRWFSMPARARGGDSRVPEGLKGLFKRAVKPKTEKG